MEKKEIRIKSENLLIFILIALLLLIGSVFFIKTYKKNIIVNSSEVYLIQYGSYYLDDSIFSFDNNHKLITNYEQYSSLANQIKELYENATIEYNQLEEKIHNNSNSDIYSKEYNDLRTKYNSLHYEKEDYEDILKEFTYHNCDEKYNVYS